MKDWIARLVFAAFAALSAYGFFAERLFDQSIWTSTGLRRLAILIVVYAVLSIALWFWRPRLFPHLVAVIATVYTIATCGFTAVLAVALMLLSSATAGTLLVPHLHGALRTLAGLAFYVFAASLLVHFPVNTWILWTCILALPLWLRPRVAIGFVRELLELPSQHPDGVEYAACALGLFPLIAHWLVVLKPEVSFDGLAMHLVIPATVEFQRQWHFDFRQTSWAVMPMNGDWAYTIAYLIGGQYAARLLNFALLMIIAVMIYELVRRWLSPATSWLVLGLFASSPIVQLVTGSLFVENFWAAMAVGAFLCILDFRERGQTASLMVAGVLTGTAVGAKLGAALFALTIVSYAAWAVRSRRAWYAAMLMVTVVTAAPSYATAYALTGNPVFPFFNQIFKSPHYDATAGFVDTKYNEKLGVRTFYDVTFRTSRHMESQNGALGFHYFVLVPAVLALWSRKQPVEVRGALIVGFMFSGLVLFGQSNVRYVYPALALLTAATGWLLTSATGKTAAVIFIVLNTTFLPASNWHHKDFYLPPFDSAERARYIESSFPVHTLIEHLNRTAPGEPAIFLENSEIDGFRGRGYTNSWHHTEFALRLKQVAWPEDMFRLMREIGANWIIAPTAESGIALPITIEQFLRECTTRELTSGSFYLARLRTDLRDSSDIERIRLAESPPAVSGTYDDTHTGISFLGSWSRNRGFRQTYNGTVVYANKPGSTARLRFSGSEITYVHSKAPNRGIAEISIDGAMVRILDLYSPEIQWQAREVVGGLGPGEHLFEVRVSGRRNAAASDAFVDVDAVGVR